LDPPIRASIRRQLDLQTAKIRDNLSGPVLFHEGASSQAMQAAGGYINTSKLGVKSLSALQKKQRSCLWGKS
jgi:hypothetical protein